MKNLNIILKIAILPIALLVFALTVYGKGNDSSDIKKVMDDQVMAWNSGNLEGFMDGYWKSEKLKFISKKGVTYGWQNVYDNYKKSFADKNAMGVLKFEIISIEALEEKNFHSIGLDALKADKSYMVVGKWMVSESAKASEGYFTLIFRKIGGRWVIVSDHTS